MPLRAPRSRRLLVVGTLLCLIPAALAIRTLGVSTRARDTPAPSVGEEAPRRTPSKKSRPPISLGRVVRSGLAVELRAVPLDPSRDGPAGFREGDNLLISLKISD